jgi:signal transduction histidine kinase
VDDDLNPRGDDARAGRAYACGVTAPPIASLTRARVGQLAMSRLVRPLPVAVAAVVLATGALSHPRPGPQGEHLAVVLALTGFAIAVTGVIWTQSAPPPRQLPFFAALVVTSAALVVLQPKGAGFLGVFIAVAAAALNLPRTPGVAVAALALVALPVADVVGADTSVLAALLKTLGVVAFYTVARLASRLAEGQEQAERLLRELEQRRDAEARAAVLAERQRLAREMHDVLAHSLSGLALQLEGARLRASRLEDDALVEALERAHQLARSGIDEARRAIGMLRGDELPGPERFPGLIADFERDTGIPATVDVDGERDIQVLDADARLTLFRTVQEALTNVRRHADAVRVELRLAYEPGGARLSVEDFGAPAAAPLNGSGYGLTGMRERAELLGGTLTAEPTDTGFRVELWVPA